MEDYLPLLWILLAVGSLVISAFSKAKAAQKRTTEAENTTQHQTQTDQDAEYEFGHEFEEVKPIEEVSASGEYFSYESNKQINTEFTTITSTSPDHIEPIEESEISNNASSEALLKDFDLQKAIIYSEILKPKF